VSEETGLTIEVWSALDALVLKATAIEPDKVKSSRR
jgi:hypothetical protein